MAVAIVDGPLGLEARHPVRSVTLNNPTVYPFWELISVGGLHDKAESDQPVDPLTGRTGEVARRSQLRGKNVTYSGVLKALDLQSMRAAVSAMRAEASNEQDMGIPITPHPSWGSVVLTILGHPAAFTCEDSWASVQIGEVPTVYQRPFVFTFRMRDPRAYALGLPVVVGAADGVAAAVTAGGTAPTEPVITFAAPGVGNIDVENVTQGKRLRLAGMPGGGGTVTVDFARRTILQGGVDVSGYLQWGSSGWWDPDAYGVAPATESLKVTGGGAWTATVVPAVY